MSTRRSHCPTWYPHKTEEIKRYIPASLPADKSPAAPLSFGIAPHAGWVYSGNVAGSVYSSLFAADTAIIIATNHTGMGKPSSVYPKGSWQMPLGPVPVDEECAGLMIESSERLEPDTEAHAYEHAIEVQVPFLQILCPGIRIVPIEMMDYQVETCLDIAGGIVRAIESTLKVRPGHRFSVIASTDMTHCGMAYGQMPPDKTSPHDFATRQDRMAIEQILSLEPGKLLEVVRSKNITMCGSGPAAVVMQVAKSLGSRKGRLIQYATSADVSGRDSDITVGYAGIVFSQSL